MAKKLEIIEKLDYRERRKRKEKSRDDRKIRQYVFDNQTLLAIDRLINKEAFDYLQGIISTGKEANVFKAKTKDGGYVAVKIYKLETSSFHSMKDYIRGDPRFKTKNNRRAIIYEWCKKEYRNLLRAKKAGVPVPDAYFYEKNVLVMELIEHEEQPALPYRNTTVEDKPKLYKQLIEYIARLLYKADLVHADLSEYNVLHSDNGPIVMDMGQSVLTSHPKAKEFLERDLRNIENFFNNQGLPTTKEQIKKDLKKWELKFK